MYGGNISIHLWSQSLLHSSWPGYLFSSTMGLHISGLYAFPFLNHPSLYLFPIYCRGDHKMRLAIVDIDGNFLGAKLAKPGGL